MSFSPVPDHKFKALTDVSVEFLKEHGISLLMLDLDNTIAPYDVSSTTDKLKRWVGRVKEAGILLHIVSNNGKASRVSYFSEELGIPYIHKARKPSPRALIELMKNLNIEPSRAALAGDQIYADVLAANGAGIMSIVVYPIRFTNPILAIRYLLELPFRALRSFHEQH